MPLRRHLSRLQGLFQNTNSERVRRRRLLKAAGTRRLMPSGLLTEQLEARMMLSGTNEAVFPDGLGYEDPVVRAAIQAITTSGETTPIYPADSSGDGNLGQSGSLINLDDFRADVRFAGIDGTGYTTVILDTGIDLDHPFFGPDADGNGIADRIVHQQDFADNDNDASDVNGHGSNVSSIVASSDANLTGMAPGADIIHLKVFENGGAGNFGYIESALQWVVANAEAFNISSINMSIGDLNNHTTAQTTGMSDEMAALVAMDVMVVSASGNSFFEAVSNQGVAYPSADPNSLSIGAVWDGNNGRVTWGSGAIDETTAAGRITSFSQRHETLTSIFAPGAFITGANQSGGTVSQGGTSQASPHVAGIAVLAQQLAEQTLDRRLTQAEFLDLMVDSASTINDGDDEDDNVVNTGLDFPLVDVFALGEAILALAPAVSITAADATKNEGNSGDTEFTFDVTRTGETTATTTVVYNVTGSTGDPADADDFGGTFPTGTITFLPTETTKTLTIDVSGDTDFEQTEVFTVSLTNPVFGRVATESAIGTIQNDDSQGDSISVVFTNDLISEADGATATTGSIVRTGDLTEELVVTLVNGDSTEITIPSAVTLAAGETSIGFNVDAVDDSVFDGTQTVTVTATADGMTDSSETIDVRDNEVSDFVRLLPLGSLASESLTSASLEDATDLWEFEMFLDAGETLAAVVTPTDAVSLTAEILTVSAAETSPTAGAAAIIAPQTLATAGFYKIRITGTGATAFEMKLLRNVATEQQVGEADPGAELAFDDSFVPLQAAGRFAVIGQSVPIDQGGSGFVQRNDAAEFIDISGSGTALGLSDDGEANITTTVGNDIFPAGNVTVGNNGGIIAGAAQNLGWDNLALPTADFGTALLPFWDDIHDTAGDVFWEERQVDGIDALIVQWHNRPHFNNVGNATFQLQLFETGPVRVRYAYPDVEFGNATMDFGISATVGIQQGPSSAEQFSFNTATLANNDVIDFVVEPPSDIDEFTLDFTGKVGHTTDIVLAGRNSVDFSAATLELLAPDGVTVLRTGSNQPVAGGSDPAGLDLGILDFMIPVDGVYTLRLTSEVAGEYVILATDSATFDIDPNGLTDPNRALSPAGHAIGHLDAASDEDDYFNILLTAGMTATVTTSTTFDSGLSTPVNSLDPEIEVLQLDGTVVAFDTNSGPDGKNASVSFAVPETAVYRIRTSATAGFGEYMLTATESAAPSLLLSVIASEISENGGVTTATVTRSNSDTSAPLTVTLTSNDTSEATVPETITIAAGETISPAFDVTAVDDLIADGDHVVSITAVATDLTDGVDSLTVIDDEVAQLTVEIAAATVREADGAAATTITISRNTDPTAAMNVTLTSSDVSEATVPATVEIPAGQVSVTVDVAAIDDAIVDGNQTVTITATAAAIADGTDTVDVIDDDTPELTLSIAAASVSESDGPAATTLTISRNTNTDAEMTVTLASDDPSEASVPSMATIAAGESSVTINLDAINDSIVDGDQTVTVTASVAGLADGVDTIEVIDDDTPALAITFADPFVSEDAGANATSLTITRNTDTVAPLDISLFSNDTSEATVPATATIPTGESSVTVFLAAVDDAVSDGIQTVTISATAASHADGNATIDVTDNETPQLTVNIDAATINEADGTLATTFTLTRNTDPAVELVVSLSSSDTSEATVPAEATIPAGQTFVVVDIAAVDDAIVDGTQPVTITATAAGLGNGVDSVDVTDDDSPELTVNIAADFINEADGQNATTLTISRNTDTSGSLVVDLASSDISEAIVPPTATILPGETSVTVSIDAVNDTLADGPQNVTITASSSTFADGSDTVEVRDDENPLLTFTIAAASVLESDGSAATTVTVARNTDTTGPLTVALVSSDETEATIISTIDIPAGAASVDVPIDAVTDDFVDGNQSVTFTVSAVGFGDESVVLDVIDVDVPTLSLVATPAFIGEEDGASATTIMITRNTPTTAELTVNLASSDTSSATVAATAVIPAGEASVIVPIDAVDDFIVDGDVSVIITASLAGFVDGTASIDVIDDDVPQFALTLAADSIKEIGGTHATTLTIQRNTDTSAELVVNLSSNDTTESTVPATATFLAGEEFVTVDVAGVDDLLVDGTQQVTFTAFADSFLDATINIDVTDNDDAGYSLTETADITAVSESGTTDTLSLVLNAQPETDIVFTVTSGNTDEAVVSPSTVTFTTLNWNVAQTITVTGVDDTSPDGDQSTTIDVAIDVAATDPAFQSLLPATINVINADDEPGRLDVDDNGTPDATTDGILIIRYLFGFSGNALTNNAIGNSANNTSAQDIIDALLAAPEMLDVDGNGTQDATTDGILTIRYLFGFRGDTLVQNATASDATRTTGQQVSDFLDAFLAGAGGGDDFGSNSAGGAGSQNDNGKGGSSGAGPDQSPNNDGSSDQAGSLAITNVSSNNGQTTIQWSNVEAASAYRFSIQPLAADEPVIRLSTLDEAVELEGVKPGSYRIWIDAIQLGLGKSVASGSFIIEIADNESADETILGAVEFLKQSEFSAWPALTAPTADLVSEQGPQHQQVIPVVEAKAEIQPAAIANDDHFPSTVDVLMETLLADGTWVD